MSRTGSNNGNLSENEKAILSLIRKNGPMPRTALALAAGVSAQAMTNLIKRLIDKKLINEREAVRGKVGQPSTPLELNAEGAYFLGLKLGRRLIELALMDFSGRIILHRQEIQGISHPDRVIEFARRGIETFRASLPERGQERIAGLGIATPFRLWDWGEDMAAWRDCDLQSELARDLPFPVILENDATTACAAELIFGRKDLPADFLHFYIAHFPGGGIVLDGNLRFGPKRNAAAIGSMTLPDGGQLIDHAAVAILERRLGRPLPPDDSGWNPPEKIEAEWAEQAGRGLAHVALAAVSLADLPLVVIDGAIPASTRKRLVEATRRALAELPTEGIDCPDVIEGSLGRSARVLGAAALPLSHFFQADGRLL